MWLPTMRYSLGTTTLSNQQLEHIQTNATGSFLTKMGFNWNFPRAVAFAPRAIGGLAFSSLPIEQGLSQLMTIMSHVYITTQ